MPKQRIVGRMNSISALRADWFRKPPNRRVKLNCLQAARKKKKENPHTLLHPFIVVRIKCLSREAPCPGAGLLLAMLRFPPAGAMTPSSPFSLPLGQPHTSVSQPLKIFSIRTFPFH